MTDITLLTAPMRPSAEIEADYVDVSIAAGIPENLAFNTAIPKLWQFKLNDEEPSAENNIVATAQFSPGTEDAFGTDLEASVILYSVYLPRAINGSDWLRLFLKNAGFTLHAIRELPSPSGLMGDAVATGPDGRLHRFVTVRNGTLLFAINGSVEPNGSESDPNLQEIALMAAIKFRLHAPSSDKFPEDMAEIFLTGENGRVAFLMPESWELTRPADKPSGGEVVQLKGMIGATVIGTMVAVIGNREDTAEGLEEVFVQKLSAAGKKMGEADKILEGTRGDLSFSAWRRAGIADDVPSTMLSIRAQHLGIPVSIGLLTPSAEAQFESWAMNRRAFEIVLETITGIPA